MQNGHTGKQTTQREKRKRTTYFILKLLSTLRNVDILWRDGLLQKLRPIAL